MPRLRRHASLYAVIVLAVAALAAGSWFLNRPQPNAGQVAATQETRPLASEEYQQAAQAFVRRFEQLVESPDPAALEQLRQDIVGLRVATEDKDLHLTLFRAAALLQEGQAAGNAETIAESERLIETARSRYGFLN